MAADSTRESKSIKPAGNEQPDWHALEPDLFRAEKPIMLARLTKEIEPQDPAPKAPTAPESRAKLAEFKIAIAGNRPVNKEEYAQVLASVGTFDMMERRLPEAREHLSEADNEIQALRREGKGLDPQSEQNYLNVLRARGRVSMLLLDSYGNSDKPNYVTNPAELAKTVQERKDLDAVFGTAVKLAEKHSLPATLLADLLRDKGLNASLLADDQYRPRRVEQLPTDLEKWRTGKEAAIEDLKSANVKLNTVLGAQDPALDLNLEKPKENAPTSAMQMRAQVLGSLAKIEYIRSNEATDRFALDAGQHFEEAITAWDKYSPHNPASGIFRSKEVNQNLLQLYNDYLPYLGIMASKSPDVRVSAFTLARSFQIQTEMANIRRVDTNAPR